MSLPIDTTYFLTGPCASDGTVAHTASHPFDVWRYGPLGVHYWDAGTQVWVPATLARANRVDLMSDLLASGAWVRELSGRQLPRDVPNYDRTRFGS